MRPGREERVKDNIFSGWIDTAWPKAKENNNYKKIME
jgi:hypothetical protein